MKYFKVKNFEKYQPKRNGKHAPWIRLYHTWSMDWAVGQLHDSHKAHWIGLICAAHTTDNQIPYDNKWLKKQCGFNSPVKIELFESLGLIEILETESEIKIPRERKKEKKKKEKKEKGEKAENINSKKVLDYLNEKAGKHFQSTKENIGFINARLETYSVEQLFHVVDVKVDEWLDDPKWDTYLRPSTLFNREKCETYVNQKRGLLKITETTGSKKLDQIKRLMGDDQQIKLLGVK